MTTGEHSKERKPIALIGPMGCGKSTIGHLMAERLGWPWVDLDLWIEKHESMSIREIFAEKGEAYFRHLEEEHIRLWTEQSPLILSLGGGAPCAPERWALLKEHFFTIYLKAEPEVLIDRLMQQRASRPLIAKGDDWESRFRDLLRERERYYTQADWTLETGSATREETAEHILEHVLQ